jgi:hypothetical protein
MAGAIEVFAVRELAEELAARHAAAWPEASSLVDLCSDAAANDRAAYWPTTIKPMIVAVAIHATRHYDLEKALRLHCDGEEERQQALDSMIPLNHQATMQLRNSYTTWPRLAELWDRQKRKQS